MIDTNTLKPATPLARSFAILGWDGLVVGICYKTPSRLHSENQHQEWSQMDPATEPSRPRCSNDAAPKAQKFGIRIRGLLLQPPGVSP